VNAKIRISRLLGLDPADQLVYRPTGRGAPEGPGWYLTKFGRSTRYLGRAAAEIIRDLERENADRAARDDDSSDASSEWERASARRLR
jgi:hypothetical protein